MTTELGCLHVVFRGRRLDAYTKLELMQVDVRTSPLLPQVQLGVGVVPDDPEARVLQPRPPLPTDLHLPAPPWVPPSAGGPYRPPAEEDA